MPDPGNALEGADSGVTAAFELVLTPVAFAVLGFFIDRWLGTSPIFLFVLAGVVAVYEIWRLWFTYTKRMEAYEAALPDARGERG